MNDNHFRRVFSQSEDPSKELDEQTQGLNFDEEDWENRDPDRIIAKRIEDIVDTYDLNHVEFAIKVDISESYISNIIRGHRPITKPLVRKICRKAGISYKWLLRGEGPILMNDSYAMVKLISGNAKLEYEDAKFLEFLFSMPFAERLIFYKFIRTLD